MTLGKSAQREATCSNAICTDRDRRDKVPAAFPAPARAGALPPGRAPKREDSGPGRFSRFQGRKPPQTFQRRAPIFSPGLREAGGERESAGIWQPWGR